MVFTGNGFKRRDSIWKFDWKFGIVFGFENQSVTDVKQIEKPNRLIKIAATVKIWTILGIVKAHGSI